MGKPHAISKEDFLVRNAVNWWQQRIVVRLLSLSL